LTVLISFFALAVDSMANAIAISMNQEVGTSMRGRSSRKSLSQEGTQSTFALGHLRNIQLKADGIVADARSFQPLHLIANNTSIEERFEKFK